MGMEIPKFPLIILSVISVGVASLSLYLSLKTHLALAKLVTISSEDTRKNQRRNSLPKAMLVIRHGESFGNLSEETYQTTPDAQVSLTEKGKLQAEALGKRLKEKIGTSPVWVYCSCYVRARETAQIALHQLPPSQIKYFREDPRLREQEFCGRFQSCAPVFAERNKYSKFFYRWETGESAADVYDRVSLFTHTMWRDFSSQEFVQTCGEEGIVLVFSHGLTSRIFLMNWLHWVFEEFDRSSNPENCAILELIRTPALGYEMSSETQTALFPSSSAHKPRRASIRDNFE